MTPNHPRLSGSDDDDDRSYDVYEVPTSAYGTYRPYLSLEIEMRRFLSRSRRERASIVLARNDWQKDQIPFLWYGDI